MNASASASDREPGRTLLSVPAMETRQHGLTNCDTDGAAKIAGEIDESRRLIGLVRRNASYEAVVIGMKISGNPMPR